MWDISSLQLAKLQFFSSLSFFSTFGLCTVVLAWLLLVCKGMTHCRAADSRWMDMYRFWVRIFALSMTVSLLGMVFLLIQSGALWPNLFVRLGPVSGPLIVLIAAITFIIKLFITDVMLYRQGVLSSWLHSVFVLLAALGLTVIAILLVAFQSWLHFPAGLMPDTSPLALADWRVFISQGQTWRRAIFMAAMACLGTGGLMVSISASEAIAKPLNSAEQLAFRVGTGLTTVALILLATSGMLFQTELFRQAAPLPAVALWAQKLVFGLCFLICLVSVVQWAWYLKRRSDFGKLPRWLLHALVWTGPASWLVLWLIHLLLSLRDGQYFVNGLVTYAEAFSNQQGTLLIGTVTVAMWVLLAVIAAGFVFLARRAARYGVVPVRKIRRTA
ncbi:hypothetical protein CAP48_08205 [Advenella sp. S44]|uniref:cytochrome ubiquinol oxidase subunit I n=1 Tax=Advenella sp. S44 TaxID=1982755 RepID=UPI000C29A78F|nr:cytochrome ubiquinol oxidase subunit I [Advenella sp. S44]PJX25995.1 hypothetical protein CAP48_08205 [Advenella sp. S44]